MRCSLRRGNQPVRLFDGVEVDATIQHEISTRRSIANERVLRDQLLCAAAEAPLAPEDRARFVGGRDGSVPEESGRVYDRALDSLRRDGSLVERSKALCCRRSDTKHAKNVPLRVVDPVTIEVRINGIVLDTVPYARAFYELFEGAIYLHQARPHLVTKLDLQARYASVKRLRTCNYITASRNHTDVDPVRVLEARGPLKTGVVHVVSKVWGYRKVCRQTFKVLELKEFSLPPLEFDSRGTWVDVPASAIEKMASLNLDARSGVHAANHALLIVAPLFVVSDPSDISTEHVYPRQHRPRPLRLILYDARPGGLGAADALFRRFHAALGQARRLLSECPCRFSAGCPACLHVHTCSGYNANLDRRAARIIVDAVLQELRLICQPVVESPARAARLRDAAVGSRLGASAAVADAWAPSLPDFRPPVEE